MEQLLASSEEAQKTLIEIVFRCEHCRTESAFKNIIHLFKQLAPIKDMGAAIIELRRSAKVRDIVNLGSYSDGYIANLSNLIVGFEQQRRKSCYQLNYQHRNQFVSVNGNTDLISYLHAANLLIDRFQYYCYVVIGLQEYCFISLSSAEQLDKNQLLIIDRLIPFIFRAAVKIKKVLHESLLTPRHKQVLELVQYGMTRNEIARNLDLSESAVKYHLNNIFSILGECNQPSAVRRALSLGLIGNSLIYF